MSSLDYRKEIDGLRAVAVVSVVIYHAKFVYSDASVLSGGFFGVDIFFVISGYLISAILLKEFGRTNRFNLIAFYERRARRLLPALGVVFLACLPLAWKLLAPTQLVDFAKSLLSSTFFVSNFYWWGSLQQYGAESGLLKPLLHTWSLAVEEQFYLLYPLVLLFAHRYLASPVFVLIILGALLGFLFAIFYTSVDHAGSFYLLPSRIWELLVGAACTQIDRHGLAKAVPRLVTVAPFFGLSMIVYSLFYGEFDNTHPGLITLLPVLGTALIILCAGGGDFVTKLLCRWPLIFIGLISYSLYLWHFPVFAFSRVYFGELDVLQKLLCIVISFTLAGSSYYLVEKPYRKAHTVSRTTLGLSLLTALGFCVAFSIYVIELDGVPGRLHDKIDLYGINDFDNERLRRASWEPIKSLERDAGYSSEQNWNKPSEYEIKILAYNDKSKPNFLVVGDSISKSIFNALAMGKPFRDRIEVARFGMDSYIRQDHVNLLRTSKNYQNANHVALVFLYNENRLEDIVELAESIIADGKAVSIVSDPPQFQVLRGMPVFDRYLSDLGPNGEFSVEALGSLMFRNLDLEKMLRVNRVLRERADERDFGYLDTFELVCSYQSKLCEAVTQEGYKTYYDTVHWTTKGSEHFSRKMREAGWFKGTIKYD